MSLEIKFFIVLPFVCSLFNLACSSKPEWEGSYETKGDVLYIRNPAFPVFKANQSDFSLNEIVHIGKDFGDSTEVFGTILDVTGDTAGNIFVLEPWGIKKYRSSGKFLSSFAKPGAGPGELWGPLFVDVNTRDHLFVYEGRGKRISIYSSQGNFLNTFKVDLVNVFDIASDAEDNIYLGSYHNNNVIHKYGKDGRFINSFAKYPVGLDEKSSFLLEGGKLAITSNGEVLVSEPNEYKVKIFDYSGHLKRVIAVENHIFTPPKIVTNMNTNLMTYEARVGIMGLIVTADNYILHQYIDYKRMLIFTDLFSPEGIFLFRWEESTDLSQSDPNGYLMTALNNHKLAFFRGRPYCFLRILHLEIPNHVFFRTRNVE